MDIPICQRETMFDRSGGRDDPALWSARSGTGMVATAHYLATEAGVTALRRGGNAVDAAVAASLALGVCEPAGSGLGGMAMMLVHLAAEGRTFVIPGPCRAPRMARPDDVKAAGRYRGHRAVAVPAAPAVLGFALERYGSLARGDLCEPAICLAETGCPVTPLQHMLITQYRTALAAGTAGRVFLDAGADPLPPGHLLRRPALARTLRRLAEHGFDDFYRGETAALIAADMARNGGFLDAHDLAHMAPLREADPVSVSFDGSRLFTAGPPAGGLALAEMAAIFNELGFSDFDVDTPEGVVLLARIIRKARRDRVKYRLKTGAEEPAEASELLARHHVRRAARRIRRLGAGAGETSHLVTADRFGNVVSLTQSIERSFGSAEIGEDLGFLYNGFMRAFKVENKRHPHFLRPGVAARSNASPTILLKDGRPRAALGSTGSERMGSGIFGVLLRLRTQDPFGAVHAPRLHCTPGSEVQVEAGRFPAVCLEALDRAGFTLRALDDYAFSMGGLQLLVREGQEWCGVGEPRRDGAAAGP